MIDLASKRIAPFWIQTHSGKAFDISNPQPSMVCIEDIAHALAQINRYTGHARWPYSVAQHSIMVAEIVAATAPELGLAALLHDAEEAYLNDWSSPLKALMRRDAEAWLGEGPPLSTAREVGAVIRAAFRLPNSPAARRLIKHADLVALATEKRDLLGPPPQEGWGDATGFQLPEPVAEHCQQWAWQCAKCRFLEAFAAYGGVA